MGVVGSSPIGSIRRNGCCGVFFEKPARVDGWIRTSFTVNHSHTNKWQQSLLVVGALLFSVLYIALAVYGWGWHSWRAYFHNPPRAVVSAAMAALFGGTFLFGCNVSTGRREEPGNNWIFLPMLLVGLLLGWLPPHADRYNLWTFGGPPVRYVGLGMFVAGTALRIGAVRVLGPRHSVWVAVQDGHRLVTAGLYRLIRHPSYAGALLALFGWPLAFRSWVGVLLALLIVFPIVSRMKAEEDLLVQEFGEEYVAYKHRTRRLIPFIY